jgi:hypothetical protein
MKLLLASDLHYIPNLADEIATNQHRLPANTYNHQIDGKLYWHNQMLVEAGEQLLDGLEQLARQEQPDLLVFLGDMVNVNWEKSIAAVAARFKQFPCPVRQVTGNHDIYLRGVEARLQEAVTPGSYDTGVRHETIGGLGLIYLDLFAKSAGGEYRKWGDPQAAERIDYRPEDIAAAFALMAAEPEKPWLIFGHFPFLSPDGRVDQAGRKMGRLWPSTATLATHLEQPNNLLGILCGHQHFAHYQLFAHGFHWTLPALVEYPCAAALLEWDGKTLQGRIVTVDRDLAAVSLRARQESWTEGEAQDQHFVWRVGG